MRLPLGTRMVRQDDGKAGVVEQVEGEPRIVYEDRRETLIAGKREKWHEALARQGPLREEEKLLVALTADKVLRGVILNQPSKLWQPIDPESEPFDAKLVRVIVEYLGTRGS